MLTKCQKVPNSATFISYKYQVMHFSELKERLWPFKSEG